MRGGRVTRHLRSRPVDQSSFVLPEPGGQAPVGTDWDEDDVTIASADFADMALRSHDVMVAVAASGSTPYTLAMARSAAQAGIALVAVVNTLDSPLAALATAAIEVPVGPERLQNSTRLTAGTAQKLILNALTTAAMVALGHVHGDLMIDVVPANAKLRDRVIGIVAEIAEHRSTLPTPRSSGATGMPGPPYSISPRG